MSTVLSRVIFPKRKRSTQATLYFRGNVQAAEKGIIVPKGNTVRFDTYFNAFFYSKYLTYTSVHTITLRLRTTRPAKVRLLCADVAGRERSLYTGVCTGDCVLPPAELRELPASGMLFFEVSAHESDVGLLGGQYETEEPPVNRVKVAAVICTFHREEYVLRNLEQLRKTGWDDPNCPIRDNLDVFIVDNGRTLTLANEAHVRLFPNPNYGGSGGFTRGLIEAYRRKGEYSHVLFMDDDISFETEALVKTLQLLKYARTFDRPLFVGGQMLIENQPTVQFEAGAFYRNGRLAPVGQGLDLAEVSALLANEKDAHPAYNAWWYCCMPLDVVDRAGLPLPLFIKTDDVEYGLRQQPHILLMNGIGVWHMAFDKKFSAYLEYYIKRNELMVSALHDNGAGVLAAGRKLLVSAARVVLTDDPRAADFIYRGCRDFLKGPDFFLQTDAAQLNDQLREALKSAPKSRLYHIVRYPFKACGMVAALLSRYHRAQQSYKSRWQEITSEAFWCGRLGLPVDPFVNWKDES